MKNEILKIPNFLILIKFNTFGHKRFRFLKELTYTFEKLFSKHVISSNVKYFDSYATISTIPLNIPELRFLFIDFTFFFSFQITHILP